MRFNGFIFVGSGEITNPVVFQYSIDLGHQFLRVVGMPVNMIANDGIENIRGEG